MKFGRARSVDFTRKHLSTPAASGADGDSSPVRVVEDVFDPDGWETDGSVPSSDRINKYLRNKYSLRHKLAEFASGLPPDADPETHGIKLDPDDDRWTDKEKDIYFGPKAYLVCDGSSGSEDQIDICLPTGDGQATEKWLTIKESTIPGAGLGLFVSKDTRGDGGVQFNPGDTIVYYSDRYFPSTAIYNKGVGDGPQKLRELEHRNEYLAEAKHFSYKIGEDTYEGAWFNGEFSIGGKVQQGTPKQVNCAFSSLKSNGRIPFFTALKSIKTGEELFVNYGWDRDIRLARGFPDNPEYDGPYPEPVKEDSDDSDQESDAESVEWLPSAGLGREPSFSGSPRRTRRKLNS
tara:strand:+ start:1788 stop:2831 length:1044 start_codon:yes stop_codon:yes gene_type:complete